MGFVPMMSKNNNWKISVLHSWKVSGTYNSFIEIHKLLYYFIAVVCYICDHFNLHSLHISLFELFLLFRKI